MKSAQKRNIGLFLTLAGLVCIVAHGPLVVSVFLVIGGVVLLNLP